MARRSAVFSSSLVISFSSRYLTMSPSSVSAIFSTSGNEDCHIILRGGGGSNYDSQSVKAASALLEKAGVPPKLMIDMSHANSGKEFKRQLEVCANICHQMHMGEEAIMGVMVESNLVEGNQKLGKPEDLVYGQSITDSCLGWDDSVTLLEDLAVAVETRRERIRSGAISGE